MAQIIKGADTSKNIKEAIIRRLDGKRPCLCVVRVGENAADLSYEKSLIKTMSDVGIEVRQCVLAADISDEDFKKEFIKVNEDKSVNGILVFRPLPKHIDNEWLENNIDPKKDMDCMSPVNIAKLVTGDDSGYFPCTAEAVVRVLEHTGIQISGKNVVIIGRSMVVGKPLGLMLLKKNATVTWCHTKTDDVPAHCKGADIIVAAAGKAGLVTREYALQAGDKCVIVDVGINEKPNGTPGICGDVAFDEVEPLCAYITPVPGGVGSVTNAVLAEHVFRAFCVQ